jgi:probable HAF family extracellular repeat protein
MRHAKRTRSAIAALVLSAATLAVCNGAAAQQLPRGYTVQDVSVGQTGRAQGPNIAGHVVEQSGALHGAGQAVVALTPSTRTTLGQPLRTDGFVPTAINDTDSVAGYANVIVTGSVLAVHAFVQTSQGFQDLGTLPGHNASQAFGLNNAGAVVGASVGPNGPRAVLWDPRTGVRDLGTLPGTTESKAFDINNSGSVVGSSGKAGSAIAFVWTSQLGMQSIGVLSGDTESVAYGINDPGAVVGYSRGPTGTHAFLWTKQNGMRALGVLGGGTRSVAQAINQQGIVVGNSQSSLPSQHDGPRAFIWTPTSGIRDLNDLIPSSAGVILMQATGINASGQIVALGRSVNNTQLPQHEGWDKAFLLTPLP